jgi:hypothetical protein
MFDLPRLAAVPAVWLFRVGVDSKDGELLAVTQKFELLGLLGAAVGCGEIDFNLRKRLVGTK